MVVSFLNLIRSNQIVGAESGHGVMSREEALSIRLRLICTRGSREHTMEVWS